jgi:hypothetical protein
MSINRIVTRFMGPPHISHITGYMPDDLEGIVDTGGLGVGFQEGSISFLVMDYLENVLGLTARINGGGAKPSAACTKRI